MRLPDRVAVAPRPRAGQPRGVRRALAPLLVLVALLTWPRPAAGYGYDREVDPLLNAFRAAIRAARAGDVDAAREQAGLVAWQLEELRGGQDLKVDFAAALARAHRPGAPADEVVGAWTNLVYLALLQKFHWNLLEELREFHRARARLESAVAYYEVALAGYVRRDDAQRRQVDPAAPSRHEDIVRRFERARAALGSPGLFGAGARPPDLAAFREATLGIAGHLNAVFPGFVRPGS